MQRKKKMPQQRQTYYMTLSEIFKAQLSLCYFDSLVKIDPLKVKGRKQVVFSLRPSEPT